MKMIKLKELLSENTYAKFTRNELALYIGDLSNMLKSVRNPKSIQLIKQDLKDVKAALAKKKNESISEAKHNKKIFDKVVNALKDIKFKATIHLNDDKITIGLGRDYFKKKNPHGTGSLDDEIENRLKKIGLQNAGIDIMASSSDFNDKKYTKAQKDIRGGV